ncbi:MAG: hypothetical protein ACR2O7_18370 [Parasphingorhabdus sp.]
MPDFHSLAKGISYGMKRARTMVYFYIYAKGTAYGMRRACTMVLVVPGPYKQFHRIRDMTSLKIAALL